MGGVGGGGLITKTDFQTGGLLERGGGLNRDFTVRSVQESKVMRVGSSRLMAQ